MKRGISVLLTLVDGGWSEKRKRRHKMMGGIGIPWFIIW